MGNAGEQKKRETNGYLVFRFTLSVWKNLGAFLRQKGEKMQRFGELIRKRADPKEKAHRFRIQKVDEDKRLVFGWASVSVTVDGTLVEDLQEDMIEPDVLEAAAYKFAELYRDGGEMHERTGVGVMVESVVLTAEKQAAMGIPAETLPVGWWIGFRITDDDVWEKVKSGEYNMFSIGGTAIREAVEEETEESSETIE